jgi:hypothetical protein
MVDMLGQAKGLFGKVQVGGVFDTLGYVILGVVIIGVVAFFVQQYLMKKKFNKSIVFWKRNPYTLLLVADKTIKAMTVRLDSLGNLGYRLQTPYETKNLIPKLKIEAKSNTHYVEYCEDGKIIEFGGIKDYDDERRAMNANFSDTNTELARSSMHQMNKERYEKTNFWKENATLLVNIGAIVVIMVFLFLIAKQLVTVTNAVSSMVAEAGKLQIAQSNIIDSLDRLLNSPGVIQLAGAT